MLNVGKSGEERLDLLHGVLKKGTMSFLNDIGVTKGKRVLELGCRNGNVTKMLSELVGDEGSVLAIDASGDQVELAKNKLKSSVYSNVSFQVMSPLSLDEIESEFDIVYSRLTLMHIPDYEKVLELMVKKAKRGGIVALEEASNAYYFHYPFNQSYDSSRKLLLDLFQHKKNDPEIGIKLHGLLSRLNLKNIESRSSAPHYTSQEEKIISLMLFREIKEKLLECHLITPDRFDEVESGLETYIKDEYSVITFPLMTQIFAMK
jgi:ubiquinone/menaquinone biosynthesis C-methylase UbiE